MRSLILAATLLVPAIAAAQTPADLARQTWQFGAPASSNTAPAAGAANPGAFAATDLARLSAQPGAHNAPPATTYASAFGPADLIRLRGDFAHPAFPNTPADYKLARIGN